MSTLGDALASLEDESFVGRATELAAFERWLAAGAQAPELLDVSGRGGVGKSALLRAFARRARALGRPVLLADCRDFPHTPAGLFAALECAADADPLAHLSAAQPLILLDTF